MVLRHSGTSCDTTCSHRDAHRVMHWEVTSARAVRPLIGARGDARWVLRARSVAVWHVGGAGECRGRLQWSAQNTPRFTRCEVAHTSHKSLWENRKVGRVP